jgi:hypothetical protein
MPLRIFECALVGIDATFLERLAGTLGLPAIVLCVVCVRSRDAAPDGVASTRQRGGVRANRSGSA